MPFPWIVVPPIVLVFSSIFSEELFDPAIIDFDGRWRPKGMRACWGMPCCVKAYDPFEDEPPDPLREEPCPVCGAKHDKYDEGHVFKE
jgi:hypothetical protein